MNKTFKPPKVFMDVYNPDYSDRIMLLRNLSRNLGLTVIMASSNQNINTFLNAPSASAVSVNEIVVYAIRILPKANLNGIVHILGWDDFIFIDKENLVFNLKKLLDSLDIQYDEDEFKHFENLIKLMKNQCETCLQGVAIFVFQHLKKKLVDQRGKQLDVKDIWKDILVNLRLRLQDRKPLAFKTIGRYHSLAMMTNYQMILEGDTRIFDQTTPTFEIILETINQHFYFFGRTNDPVVVPFIYDGTELRFNGEAYQTCSYFKLFFENVFFCLAVWIAVGYDQFKSSANNEINFYKGVSVASIVTEYIMKLRNASTNQKAAKNNFSIQECVIHWALCISTSKSFSNLNSGFHLLKRFIFNVQIDEETIIDIKNFNINIGTNPITESEGFSREINFNSSLKLF